MNYNFSLNIELTVLKLSGSINNILMEETMSQNGDSGPSSYFMSKKMENFVYLFLSFFFFFIDFIKT